MKVIAMITEPNVIDAILRHLARTGGRDPFEGRALPAACDHEDPYPLPCSGSPRATSCAPLWEAFYNLVVGVGADGTRGLAGVDSDGPRRDLRAKDCNGHDPPGRDDDARRSSSAPPRVR